MVRGVVPVGLAGGTEVAASRPPAGIKTISMIVPFYLFTFFILKFHGLAEGRWFFPDAP